MVNVVLAGNNVRVRVTSLPEQDTLSRIPSMMWRQRDQVWVGPVTALYDLMRIFPTASYNTQATVEGSRLLQEQMVIEELKSGLREPRPHPFLVRAQRLCLDIAAVTPAFAFFLATGVGKTLTALGIIAENVHMKWIVVCPKSIIRPAWMMDAKNFYPELRVLAMVKENHQYYADRLIAMGKKWKAPVAKGMSIKKLYEVLADRAHVLIINPESFDADFALAHGVTGLIYDESVQLKNPSSQRTKKITEFAKHMDKRYILSGIPAPNNELEYFTQMRIVDPFILGDNYFKFRGRYFQPYGYMGYQWKLMEDKRSQLAQRISLRSLFISKQDCLDLPPITYEIREVLLDNTDWKYYKQMEKTRVLLLPDDAPLTAPNILTMLMKLRQITSGFVLTEDSTPALLHRAKLDELLNLLDGMGEEPVIIWCTFQEEIRQIEEELLKRGKTVVTAYGGTKNVDDSTEKFSGNRNGSKQAQYMVAHPATLRYGVTFVDCTTAIYYSLSYSYNDYAQSHDRIYRRGQEKPCTFIFLLVPRTIDTVLYNVVHKKQDLSQQMEKMVKNIVRDIEHDDYLDRRKEFYESQEDQALPPDLDSF